jgi:serine/threonine-protein kinase RsbT
MAADIRIPVASDADIVPARAQGRELATRLGFSKTDTTLIATAISEIARNIVVHVGEGEISIEPIDEEVRCGLLVVARDSGPGIRDVEAALRTGHGSRNGLGLGLPGARRLMDEFDIETTLGVGTTVTMKKWRVRDDLERLREARNGSR